MDDVLTLGQSAATAVAAEPISLGEVYKLRIELLPMPVLVRKGERLRLEISNWESSITEAPMTYWYGQKVGTDTYPNNARHPSRLRLHDHPWAVTEQLSGGVPA